MNATNSVKNLMGGIALLISSSALATPSTVASQLLSADTASDLAQTTMAECRSEGYAVSAAVVDRAGNLLAFARHEMAGPHTISSSQQKAFTAASMGQETGKLAKLVTDKPIMAGLRDMHPNLLLLEGGIPVVIEGVRVAGIGVGGAPGGHLDAACATRAMKKVLGQ